MFILPFLNQATVISGLTVALLLCLAPKPGKTANRWLSLALVMTLVPVAGFSTLPLLAVGPLGYFCVRQLTQPAYRLRWKDTLHFLPLVAGYWLPGILILSSVTIYSYLAHRAIQRFYERLPPVQTDRPRFAFRQLEQLLICCGLFAVLAGFNSHFLLGLTWVLIIAAATALLKPVVAAPLVVPRSDDREKARRLKEAVLNGRWHEDPELTLPSLAASLGIHPHDLSRIINNGLKKNFSDFINELRVREAMRKIRNPAYARLTLLGIAAESGFNSQRTFNRAFKEISGQTPAEYKNSQKKEWPIDKLTNVAAPQPLTLRSENHKRNVMLKIHLKTAYRNLIKNKSFTAINILGLSVGLATCLLIVLYVADELSYDHYNLYKDRIYRISTHGHLNGNDNTFAGSEKPWTVLVKDFPGVEKTAFFVPLNSLFLSSQRIFVRKGQTNIQEQWVVYTTSAIFDLFTLPAVDGKPALDAPHTAVISESAALKYFNTTRATGKTLTINDTIVYQVTAVVKDVPSASHFHYDLFLSYASIPEYQRGGWGYASLHQYVLLKPGADTHRLEAQMQKTAYANYPASVHEHGNSLKYILTPLLDLHLRGPAQNELSDKGNIQYVYTFSVIAVFILLIACVNFMNLSTARSANRAKEVGVRKVLGSARALLIIQFLTESILVVLVAALIAVGLAWLAMPLFNQLAAKELAFTFASFKWLLPGLLFIVLVVGLLAGSYPAFYLSAFQPVRVLKGTLATGFKSSFLRSFLVVFQFSISIFLIVGTLVIYDQLRFIHDKDLGFDRSQVLVIKNTGPLGNNADILKRELAQMSGVKSVTMTTYVPTGSDRNITGLFPALPIDIKQDVLSEFWPTDTAYLRTMGIQLLKGRNFMADMGSDSSALIVNEAFVKRFGFKDPIGKPIYRFSFGLQQFHIIGVMKDFNFSSLRDPIKPVALVGTQDRGAISARISTAQLPSLLAQLKARWAALSPNQSLDYSFMDQDFDAAYRSEQRVGGIFIAFSSLAILIACLGLFGLAAYAAEQRTKEIGIRKVLGASVGGIVQLLSLDFIKLVGIAILIAAPLAWYAMNRWLQDFAYRITISWWVLAAAGVLALLIAFLTVSFQSVRAALTNPVKSLRTE